MDSSSYVLNGETKVFKINHGDICKGATDDQNHDRLCGVYMSEKNKECRVSIINNRLIFTLDNLIFKY